MSDDHIFETVSREQGLKHVFDVTGSAMAYQMNGQLAEHFNGQEFTSPTPPVNKGFGIA